MTVAVVHVRGSLQGQLRLLPLSSGPGTDHVARCEALLKSRADGDGPDTLWWWRCDPESVLLGMHQAVDLEVRERFTAAHGIAIARRITGGGAALAGAGQLLWALVLRPDVSMEQDLGTWLQRATGAITAALVGGLATVGVDARTGDDGSLLVGPCRVGLSWATHSRGVVLVEGIVHLREDVGRRMDALRAPAEKMPHKAAAVVGARWTDLSSASGRQIEAEEVIAALSAGLSAHLDLPLVGAALSTQEQRRIDGNVGRFADPTWVRRVQSPPPSQGQLRSMYRTDGGFLWTFLRVDGRGQLRDVTISGDVVCNPLGALQDLCQSLQGVRADPASIRLAVQGFLEAERPHLPGVGRDQLARAVIEAADRTQLAEDFGLSPAEANDLWLVPTHSGERRSDTLAAIRGADVMLMPFCSKALDCELRYTLDCTACGGCTTGVGYELAQQRGMACVTLCNAEHFQSTLSAMKAHGARAFIGACCEPFMAKHREEFEALGVPGLLLGIEKVTCYEVDLDRDERGAQWQELADLKVPLLRSIMAQVPGQAQASTFAGTAVPDDVKRLRADQKVIGGGRRMSPHSPV